MRSLREQKHRVYDNLFLTINSKSEDEKKEALGVACKEDLFFLLWWGLGRVDVDRDWIFDRCNEVQNNPNGYLDLWFRGGYKSTIITYALTIQDILNNPSETICIFSHVRSLAKAFLRQIKYEFETNHKLKDLFPDILWKDPKSEAPKWSEDEGIVVKRPNPAPKEATVEAWGLIDGMPTGKHYRKRIYDDVVTEKSVTTPEMIKKTTDGWSLSLNLTAEGGIERYIGTYYHHADTYHEIEKRGAAITRKYPGTSNGKLDGEPVLMTQEELIRKRKNMGSYTFACQILLNPTETGHQVFQKDWLKFWPAKHVTGLNIYIFLDPANEKKKKSDYSAFMVVGLGSDGNYYVIDMIRDRLNLRERTTQLFRLHREYRPILTYIEKYGKDADIEHYQEKMEQENYRFSIIPLGGRLSKGDRIRKLQPLFEEGRLYLPETCMKTNYEGTTENLVQVFIDEEYTAFPLGSHDDMLDCLARTRDDEVSLTFPEIKLDNHRPKPRPTYNPLTSMV